MPDKLLTVVIPVFNEEGSIDPLTELLDPVLDSLDLDTEVLFIDDGSRDGTLEALRAQVARHPRYRALSFSRNFGKENAMAAGFAEARGDAVLVMDGDLQHPPASIPAFVDKWRSGSRVVFGQRMSRHADPWLRKRYSDLFHAVFRWTAGTRLPRGIVDFVLLDRSAVDALNRMDERTRFSKGMFAWIGFNTATVPFESEERVAGQTTFNLLRLTQFALDGILSFSTLPLRVWSYVGVFFSVGAIFYSVYFFIKTLLFGVDTPGFPSLMVSISFFAGVQLISLGVIGEYLGRVFDEVKRRPLYIIAEDVGHSEAATAADHHHG